MRRAGLSPSGAQRRKGSPWRIVPQKPRVFQPRIVREKKPGVLRTPGAAEADGFERVASQQREGEGELER